MGENKQPRTGRAGDLVPPSATTTSKAFQEAKNTRWSKARDRSALLHVASQASCANEHAEPSSASYRACSRPTKTCSSRAYCGDSPGETRRSYLLQGSLVVGVSPKSIHPNRVAPTLSIPLYGFRVSIDAVAPIRDQRSCLL